MYPIFYLLKGDDNSKPGNLSCGTSLGFWAPGNPEGPSPQFLGVRYFRLGY